MENKLNLTLGIYQSCGDIVLSEESYFDNELFKDGVFQYDLLNDVITGIDRVSDVICKVETSCYSFGYDTFYVFKDGSKTPLTIKELEEMKIIVKEDNYDEIIEHGSAKLCDTYKVNEDFIGIV